MPQGDGHYKPFDTTYNTVTSEEHHPSLQNHPVRQTTLPFVASVRHAKNTNLMVTVWRVWDVAFSIYSKYKLTKAELTELSTATNDYTYTCGASLSDLGLPGQLKDVAMWLLRCYDPLEKLYYSLNKEPICIYCRTETDVVVEEGFYPRCPGCKDKPAIKKRV